MSSFALQNRRTNSCNCTLIFHLISIQVSKSPDLSVPYGPRPTDQFVTFVLVAFDCTIRPFSLNNWENLNVPIEYWLFILSGSATMTSTSLPMSDCVWSWISWIEETELKSLKTPQYTPKLTQRRPSLIEVNWIWVILGPWFEASSTVGISATIKLSLLCVDLFNMIICIKYCIKRRFTSWCWTNYTISSFKIVVLDSKIGSGVCYYIWYATYHVRLLNLFKYSLLELVLKYLEKTIQVFDPKVSYQQRWNIDCANHPCLIYCERHFYHSLHPKKIVEIEIRGSW